MVGKLMTRNAQLIICLALAAVTGLIYLTVAAWGFGVAGFPLDDAWIHQTYARNLARSGQLAFTPGIPSAGSTAPLWSFLLSVGYVLGIPFRLWAYGLGLIFLGLTGWTVMRLGQRLFPEDRRVGLWAGLFCLFEWHLVWSAVSGMETMLFVWLSLFLVEQYVSHLVERPSIDTRPRLITHIYLGLLAGLLILTRPEGLMLLGLIGLYEAYRVWSSQSTVRELLRNWAALALGVGVLLAPYVAFHMWATGLPLPNTFYAKQAEYGIILEAFPLWWRLFGGLGPAEESVQGVFRVIFIGPQLLLLPGLLFAAWLTVKERRTRLAPIWLWWVSFLVLYAVRLPVTYQHGRYQIPAIAWAILLGVWGTNRLLTPPPTSSRGRFAVRIVSRVILISVILLLTGFTILGARAYGRDVAIIEGEMVIVAKWLHVHTEPGVLIAAHDIGAIGYFTQRRIIDLAGLVTPEVIPIIRDEEALIDFVIGHRADYLVTFPSWYPQMTQSSKLNLQYQTDSSLTRAAGGENMSVYGIAPPNEP